MMETFRHGTDRNGNACFWNAKAWWKAQQVLWENRQIVRGVNENGKSL